MGLFRPFGTLARRVFKGSIALTIGLLVGLPIADALGFIELGKTVAIVTIIFAIILFSLSRRVPRKLKFVSTLLMIAVWCLVKASAFPELPRAENAVAQEANRYIARVTHRAEMPKEVACTDPFVDAKTGEPIKFYRVVDKWFTCYDRPGAIKGEELRPVTNDVAYLIGRDDLKPEPPAPQPEATPAPTPAPVVVYVQPAPQHTPKATVDGAIPCDRDEWTKKLCWDLKMAELRDHDRALR